MSAKIPEAGITLVCAPPNFPPDRESLVDILKAFPANYEWEQKNFPILYLDTESLSISFLPQSLCIIQSLYAPASLHVPRHNTFRTRNQIRLF